MNDREINELTTQEFITVFNDGYNKNDLYKCKSVLFKFVLRYNKNNIEIYNHEVKHILFHTCLIKNPMGMKYEKSDYEKTISVFSSVIEMVKINNNNVDLINETLKIIDPVVDDLCDIITYTELLYKMNINNSSHMDNCDFSKKTFFEQLITSVVYFQDQYKLAQIEMMSNVKTITGMEISIANRNADNCNGLKTSISDNFELLLEALNEIIRLLYYKNRGKFVDKLDILNLSSDVWSPYYNVEFEKYLYIAIQRHMLQAFEEKIRCGFICFNSICKDENGIDVYLYKTEEMNKTKARFLGIFRREYQARTTAMFDVNILKNMKDGTAIISKLSAELLELQAKNFKMFDFTNFKPNKSDFLKAESVTIPKKKIVELLTKKFYFSFKIKGINVNDITICYYFLDTISKVLEHSNADLGKKCEIRQVSIVDINYLCNLLSEIHDFDFSYSMQLLNCFIFHEKNNKDDDIFAQPLLKISNSQVILVPAFVDQVILDRVIERQFIRNEIDHSDIGHVFEKYFIESLQNGYKKSVFSDKRIPIPNLKINTNHIEYKAFDGKDIEFDIVLLLGDYLVLVELKSIMTSYDLTDLCKRKKRIDEAVDQLKRRRNSVVKDWDIFRKLISFELPENVIREDHIILVACSDAYDFTPLKQEDVYITDDSTFLRYFTNPFINMFADCTENIRLNERKMWRKEYPDVHEFIENLISPNTTKYIDSVISFNKIPIPVIDDKDYLILIDEPQCNENPIEKYWSEINTVQNSSVTKKKKISKNTRCPCGSGKKFKKCCKGNGKYD